MGILREYFSVDPHRQYFDLLNEGLFHRLMKTTARCRLTGIVIKYQAQSC